MLNAVLRAVGVADDDSFGPQLWPEFDFTLLFEHTILTILPASLLIIASPFYLFRYFRSPVYVSGSFLSRAKIASTGALIGVEIAALVLVAVLPAHRSNASLSSSCLGCTAAVVVAAIINVEHRRSLRSSAFISLYLGTTLLFDAVKSRSYFLRDIENSEVIGALSAAIAAVKLIILLLEEMPKRKHIRDSDLKKSLSKETASGFWNRSLFIWLNSTLLLGFRRKLHVEHLDNLESDFASEQLSTRFAPIWEKHRHASYPLMKACFLTLTWPFLSVVIPRCMHIAFLFSQPFLLERVVSFLGEQDASSSTRNGLIGATILVYSGKAITKTRYDHMNYRLVTRLRGLLVAEILKKTLLISQNDASNAAAITLMSTDVEGLVTGLPSFHEVWASFVEFGIGAYLLTTVVGSATCLLAFSAILTIVTSLALGLRMLPARAKWNGQIQERVAVMSQILKQIKSIKFIGLQPVAADMVQNLRVSELEHSKTFRRLFVVLKSAVILCSLMTPPLIITGAVFWTSLTAGLAIEIFKILAFLALTNAAMMRLMSSYSLFLSILGCFERIETYLQLRERQDERETISDLVLRHSSSGNEVEGESKRSSESSRKPSIQLQLPQPPIVFVDASIAAVAEKQPILCDVNFTIKRSEITMVLGCTGSGKSTLLRAILGEAHTVSGLVYVEQRQIAYCDQSPWLRNVSIRENIVVKDAEIDRHWYGTVLDACLLSDDLRQLPDGDMTKAGNNGANLSGGQRQRVALARAVYAGAPLLVLDDIFSSLDRKTADAVFERLFTSNGLLKRFGSTVVLTTHIARYVNTADRIIMIENDGSLTCTANVANAQGQAAYRNLLSVDTGTDLTSRDSVMSDNDQSQEPTVPGGNASARRGDFGLYKYYLASTTQWLWVTWVIVMMAVVFTEKMPDVFIKLWLDSAPGNRAYLPGYLSIPALSFIFSVVGLILYHLRIVPQSAERLHQRLLNTVMRSSMSSLSSTSSASLINLFSQDMTFISQELPSSFYILLYVFFRFLFDLGVIASATKYVAPAIPLICAFYYMIQHFYLRTSRQIRDLDLESKTPLYSQFMEMTTSNGLAHIRSYGWQNEYRKQSLTLLDDSQRPFYHMFCIQRWLNLVMNLSVLGVATILVSAAVCTRSLVKQSALGLALVTLINFGSTMTWLIETWSSLETSLGAISRIRSYTENTPVEIDCESPSPLPSRHGSIQMTNVTSTYRPLHTSPKIALDRVSLSISARQKVAVVGRTGSGKSSLLSTLLNFVDYSGSIHIDGMDLSSIPRQDLTSMITAIAQDPVELPGTVRLNIDPPDRTGVSSVDHARDGVLEEVLEKTHLLAYIRACGGLDAPVMAMGFSHGQKQLLAVARALLHHLKHGTKIILVDEATSSLDAAMAETIERILDEAFQDCTVVSVSHRPEIVANKDIIVEIRDGRIVSLKRKNVH